VKLCTKWLDLPKQIREHLQERLRSRKITLDDLDKLRFWMESQPDIPEGDWFKNFGSFKIVGRGLYPLTFLDAEQIPYGMEISPGPESDPD
jgi:hypothetical protein